MPLRRCGAALRVLGVAPLLALLTGCAPRLADTVPLKLVHQEMVQVDSLEELSSLHLADPGGGLIRAYLRKPVAVRCAGACRLPAIVLVAGRETGREAAAVVPGPLDGVVLAVEYPAEIPETPGLGSLGDLAAMRRAAYRMPGVLRGAARVLASRPEVDSARIALVGVSFGVPFAAAAGRDRIFRGVALHHGGADLELLFRTNLDIPNGLLRSLVARFAAWYLGRLEPARHVGGISPTPLLLINGTRDSMVPIASARLLAAHAGAPVRHVWLPHDHLMPGDLAVMRELADSTIRHFHFLRTARRDTVRR